MGRGRDKRDDVEAKGFEDDEGPSLPGLILFPASAGEGEEEEEEEEKVPCGFRGGVFSEGRESGLLSLAGLISLVSNGATGC